MKHRKRIAVGEKIPLELTERERDLIMKHTFADNNLTDRLRVVPSPGANSSRRCAARASTACARRRSI